MEITATEALVWRLFGLAMGIGTTTTGARSFCEETAVILSGTESEAALAGTPIIALDVGGGREEGDGEEGDGESGDEDAGAGASWGGAETRAVAGARSAGRKKEAGASFASLAAGNCPLAVLADPLRLLE